MTTTDIDRKVIARQVAQFILILLLALTLKLYYSSAGVNQLRWILAPTTAIVEFVTGLQFEFESHAGYISGDRSFVIAASCAGVNFLITAFLMLSLIDLWQNGSRNEPAKLAWWVIPHALFFAFVATLIANTIRISIALRLRETSFEIAGLSPNQLHRLEGIVIYFGCLMLLFVVSSKLSAKTGRLRKGGLQPRATANSKKASDLLRLSLFPLLVYYATTLGLPLANGAYRQGRSFWEHSVFVLVTPLVLIVPLAAFRYLSVKRVARDRPVGAKCLDHMIPAAPEQQNVGQHALGSHSRRAPLDR